jgi:hypothetical protein
MISARGFVGQAFSLSTPAESRRQPEKTSWSCGTARLRRKPSAFSCQLSAPSCGAANPGCSRLSRRRFVGQAERLLHKQSSQRAKIFGFSSTGLQPVPDRLSLWGSHSWLPPPFRRRYAGWKAGCAVEDHRTIGCMTWHRPSACAGQAKGLSYKTPVFIAIRAPQAHWDSLKGRPTKHGRGAKIFGFRNRK